MKHVRTASRDGRKVPANCRICGADFQAKLSEVKRGRGTLCSIKCVGVTHRKERPFKITRTYRIWSGMKQRSGNPFSQAAYNYIGRGIGYFSGWETFAGFLADMGECPEGMSLDRIDNDKGYGPDNCRWANRAEQSRNTRRNILINIDGETMVLADALAKVGYSYQAMKYLRDRHNWSPQEVFDQWKLKGFVKLTRCGLAQAGAVVTVARSVDDVQRALWNWGVPTREVVF